MVLGFFLLLWFYAMCNNNYYYCRRTMICCDLFIKFIFSKSLINRREKSADTNHGQCATPRTVKTATAGNPGKPHLHTSRGLTWSLLLQITSWTWSFTDSNKGTLSLLV